MTGTRPRPSTSGKPPRFNHVGLSMPADELDAAGRGRIIDFYGEVFGWQELPTMTIDRQRLVLMAHRYDQFVFLVADDTPMRAARLDHFGQAVDSLEELTDIRDRIVAFRNRLEADEPDEAEKVDLIDIDVENHPGLDLHACYVGYRLPFMVETQYWGWTG
jgi:hypothetical protein